MAYNVDDFNRILADINAKIDGLASESEEKAVLIESMKNAFDNKNSVEIERLEEFSDDLNELRLLLENSQNTGNYEKMLDELRNLQQAFRTEIMNMSFDKNSLIESVKDDIVKVFEKAAFLDELYPAKGTEQLDDIRNAVCEKIVEVQNNIDGHIKTNYDTLAQAIGALYGAIEKVKKDLSANNSLDVQNITGEIQLVSGNTAALNIKLDELLAAIDSAGADNKTILETLEDAKARTDEISNVLNSSLNAHIEDLKMDTAITADRIESLKDELKNNAADNLSQILGGIQNSSELINEFRKNLSISLTEYLNTINKALGGFVDECKHSQQSFQSEFFDSQIEKLEKISAELNNIENSIDAKSNDYRDFAEEKTSEIKDVLQNIESIISASGEQIANSLTEKISYIEELISEKSAAKDEKLDNLEKTLDEYSGLLNNHFANVNEDFKNFDEKITSKVDTISDIASNVSAKSDEIALNIRTNLSSQIGDLKTDISIVSDRIDTVKDEMSKTANDNISQIMTGLSSTSRNLDEFKENVSEHLSEYLTAIKEALESFSEDLSFTQEAARSDIIDRQTAEFDKLAQDIEKLNADLADKDDDYKSYIAGKIDEVHNYLVNLKEQISESNSGLETLLAAKIAELDELITKKSLPEDEKLDNLDSKMDVVSGVLDNVSGKTDEQITNIKEIKTLINSVFEEIQKNREVIQSDLSKNNENSVSAENTLAEQLKTLENSLSELSAQQKFETNEKISQISSMISELKGLLEHQDDGNFDNLCSKLDYIENVLNESFAAYDGNMAALQEKLGEYILSSGQISADTNSKLENSLLEVLAIRKEVKDISEKINSEDFDKNADFDKRIDEVLYRFTGITENIEDFKLELNENIKSLLKENVDFVDSGLGYISKSLNEIRENKATVTEFPELEEIDGKLTGLKEELALINTDVIQTVNDRGEALLREFEPLKTALEKFASFSFEEVISEMKNQIQLSYLNLLAELNDNLTDNQDAYLKIENTYKDIVFKCSSLESSIADFTSNNMELMNSTLETVDANVKLNLDKTTELFDKWESSIGELTEKINTVHKEFEHSLVDLLSDIDKTLDEKLLLNQKDMQDYLVMLFSNQNFAQLIENSSKETFDRVEELKLQIQEGFDALGVESLIDTVKDVLHNAIEVLNDKFIIMEQKVDVLSRLDNTEILDGIGKTSEKVIDSLKELNEKFEEFSTKDNTEYFAGINSNCEDIHQSLSDLHSKVDLLAMKDNEEGVDEIVSSCESIKKAIYDLQSKVGVLSQTSADTGSSIDEAKFFENFERIQKSIEELNAKADILAMADNSEIQDDVAELSEKVMTSLNELHSKVDVIALGSDNEYENEIEELSDRIMSSISELEKKTERLSVSDNSEIKEDLKSYSDSVISSVAELHSKIDILAMTDTTESLSDEILEFSNRISDSLAKLHSKLEALAPLDKDNIADYSAKISDAVSEIRDTVESFTVSNNIKEYFDKVISSVTELHSKIDILAMTDASESFSDEILEFSDKISDSVAKLHSKIDGIASEEKEHLTDYSDKIMNAVSGLQKKIDELPASNSDNIMSSLSELHSKVDILAMNENTDINDAICDSSEKILSTIDELHKKVDILAQEDNSAIQDDIEDIKNLIRTQQKLFDNTMDDEISAKLEDIIQTLDHSDDKIAKTLELLHSKVDILAMADDNEIKEEIQDIKELIERQKDYFEKDSGDGKSSEIKTHLEKLIGEINKIEKNVSELDLEKNSQDIKDSVMTAMLAAMEQVSFVEETEEIKDFVEEKTTAINQTLLDVKKQLSKISNTSDDMDFYSYTLQDVESDLAKLRLTLNELSSSSNSSGEFGVISANISRIAKSVEQLQMSVRTNGSVPDLRADFNKLSEDIVSLSVRTNKILLNSNEAQRVMNMSLREFELRTRNLQNRLDEIDNKNIDKRLSLIEQKVDESVNSTNILRNVMIYLGEWMDGTSETISSIYDKSVKAASTHDLIEELKLAAPQQTDLLKAVEKRFEDQESRIDRLEQKLEKALDLLSGYDENVITAKIDRIDKHLGKLTENIEKLTAYVDEE